MVLIWMTVLLFLVGMASSYFCSRFIHPGRFSGPFGVVILIRSDWSVFRFPFFRGRPLMSLAEIVLHAAELEGRPLRTYFPVGLLVSMFSPVPSW